MLVAKQVADLITMGRALLAILLVWLGLTHGVDALPLVAWVMIAAWTSDSVDGPIARSSRTRYQTWVGDHDLEIDMAVAGSLLFYLLAAGYIDLRLAGVYFLVWALIFWRWGVPRALGMLVQAPIYGWLIWVTVRDAPTAGWWLVGWILMAVVLTWPRFPKEIVPGFLAGMREVWEAYRRDGA